MKSPLEFEHMLVQHEWTPIELYLHKSRLVVGVILGITLGLMISKF